MTTQTLSYYEIATQLPADTVVTFHGVGWEEYEELLAQVGEAGGLRISYDSGKLQVMTLSAEHENYSRFIEQMIGLIRLRLRLNIRFFGSATMKKQKGRKGTEPDACFYVQTAAVIGHKMQLDFTTDPPPDIVVEVDLHHESLDKFPIYAALGVPEIWRFDGQELVIYHLEQDRYITVESSPALPLLASRVLTEFLMRLPQEGEFQTILAFDEWLQARSQ